MNVDTCKITRSTIAKGKTDEININTRVYYLDLGSLNEGKNNLFWIGKDKSGSKDHSTNLVDRYKY